MLVKDRVGKSNIKREVFENFYEFFNYFFFYFYYFYFTVTKTDMALRVVKAA